MLKVIRSVVLKNVEFWNGKTFEHRDAVYLGNSGNFLSPEIAKQTNFDAEIDCDNALVMPAMFGLSLDFMAPQRDDVYTFAQGLKAMHRGGFYGGLYESAANPIDNNEKLFAAQQRLAGTNYQIKFLGSYSVGFGSDRLSEMLELTEGAGFANETPDALAGFGDGNVSFPTTRFLRLAMEYGKMTGKRFFFTPMDKSLRKSGCVHEGAFSDMLGMKGIPRIAETIAAHTVLELARFLNVPVHFKQVTCGETLQLIKDARQKGIDVTCDVNLYHLLFDDSVLLELNSSYHLLPPLRASSDKAALWEGIQDGTVDAISVNHTPVLRQDAEVNFEDSVPGALSLEVALPAIWKELSKRVSASRAIELLSSGPARLSSAPLAYDENDSARQAHLVVLSSDKPHLVSASDFAGQVCNSPLLGKELPSSILGTYINGIWRTIANA